MKPARGSQTEFFSNSCNGIPGLVNYEMLNEVCEGNFWVRFLGIVTAVLDSRLLAAELGKSRLIKARVATSNPGFQAIGS